MPRIALAVIVVSYRATYDRSWAIVVGIDQYQAMPPLSYAVADARAIVDVLVGGYDFASENIILLENNVATQEGIRAVFDDRLTNPNLIGKDDRVLFFFAGHGVTRPGQRGDVGYIAPVDAIPGAWRTLIGMDDIIRAAEFIPAKHIFLIMDACYSGLSLLRGVADRFSDDMVSRQAWQVLTAGKANQPVADGAGPHGRNSLFTGYLLDGLCGQAADERGMISASSLMYYVYRQVSNDSHSTQTPHYGWLRGDGDFIFHRAAPIGAPPQSARALSSPVLAARLAAVGELALIATGKDPQLAEMAAKTLDCLAQEDSENVVRLTAGHALGEIREIARQTSIEVQADTIPSRKVSAPTLVRIPQVKVQPAAPSSRRTVVLGTAVLVALLALILMLFYRGQSQDDVIADLQTQIASGQQLATLVDEQEAAAQAQLAGEIVTTKQAEATATIQAQDTLLAPLEGDVAGVSLDITPTVTLQAVVFPQLSPDGSPMDMAAYTGNILFTDDFGADQGSWQTGRILNADRAIRDGQLFLSLDGQYSLWFSAPSPSAIRYLYDFDLDVDATILTPGADGTVVIAFRMQPPTQGENVERFDDYYYVGLDLGGNAFMFKQQNGQTGTITPITALGGGIIEPGRAVRLRLSARRDRFTLYVNGVEAIQGRDLMFASGQIALGAWSRSIAPFAVAYDNFSISNPSSGE